MCSKCVNSFFSQETNCTTRNEQLPHVCSTVTSGPRGPVEAGSVNYTPSQLQRNERPETTHYFVGKTLHIFKQAFIVLQPAVHMKVTEIVV